MKNLTWQNPEQLFVAQELINKVKSKCCGIKEEIVPLDGSGVQALEADNSVIQINSIRGERLETPSKGINIIKMKDGTTKKVLVK